MNENIIAEIYGILGDVDFYIGSFTDTDLGQLPTAICVPNADTDTVSKIAEVTYKYEDDNHESRTICIFNSERLLNNPRFDWRRVRNGKICC